MSTNPYIGHLRKILPFIGRNVCYSDRELYMRRFRKYYTESPEEFLDAYDIVIEELRKTYPHEIVEMIDSAGLSEIDDQVVASTRQDGTTSALYAAGFFAYGLENQPLNSEMLLPEDAKELRGLLVSEYFSDEAEIRIYKNLIPLNHTLVSNPDDSQKFLAMMNAARSDFVPQDPALDLPGFNSNYDEEEESDITARFRLIVFSVRSKSPDEPALKRPYRFNGFAVPQGDLVASSTDKVLETTWGAKFSAFVAKCFGRGLRYAVTEPYLLNDTVRQLDYVTGLKRVMVTFTRTALDENVAPEELIVSMGAFSDPQRGYSELRVAFALPSAPDDLINGVPIPLPTFNTDRAVEELAQLVRATFELEGIRLRTPISEDCPMLTAEPDTLDRLYNSIHNIQKPLKKRSSEINPRIPSMLLN